MRACKCINDETTTFLKYRLLTLFFGPVKGFASQADPIHSSHSSHFSRFAFGADGRRLPLKCSTFQFVVSSAGLDGAARKLSLQYLVCFWPPQLALRWVGCICGGGPGSSYFTGGTASTAGYGITSSIRSCASGILDVTRSWIRAVVQPLAAGRVRTEDVGWYQIMHRRAC